MFISSGVNDNKNRQNLRPWHMFNQQHIGMKYQGNITSKGAGPNLIPPNSREKMHLKKSSDKGPHFLCSIQTAGNRWGLNRQLVGKNMYYPSTTYKVMPPNDKLAFKAPFTIPQQPRCKEVNLFSLIWKRPPHETMFFCPGFPHSIGTIQRGA